MPAWLVPRPAARRPTSRPTLKTRKPAAAARSAPSVPAAQRAARQRARRLRRWAIVAVLFPVFFLVVIGIGIGAMYSRRMQLFKPPPVGALRQDAVALAAGNRPVSWTPAPPRA